MDNPLALFSKNLCQGQAASERELERLHADLNAENNWTQQGFVHLSAELRRLREKAEYEHQRAVKELAARQKCQKDRVFQSCSHEVAADSAGCWSLCLCGSKTYAKLEQLLEILNKKIAGEQPVYKLYNMQGFELEKAIFLCHLLKANRILLQERRRVGRSIHNVTSFSRKLQHKESINSCLTGLLQTCSRGHLQRLHSGSHLPKKQSNHNQQEWPVGEDPCLPATALDTCWISSLKICHPPNVPHAGWSNQPPNCTELHRSEEFPSPRCTDRNMEGVMHDLCSRPEQPEPPSAPTGMGSYQEDEAVQHLQQELKKSEDDKQRGISGVDGAATNTSALLLGKQHHCLYVNLNGFEMEDKQKNGTEYGFLVCQNDELLRALDELERTCTTLREENGLLRKSCAPEMEEKVKRLRRKNTELAVLAKRLEERARKLQEANLKVVNSPSLMKPGSVEQYKRAFARQRARDLAQHADTLLSKDKEIGALQQQCRELDAQVGTRMGSSVSSGRVEFERLLRESQREVLRLQRQLSVTSSRQQHSHSPNPDQLHTCGVAEVEGDEKVTGKTPVVVLDEAPSKCEKTPGEEEESREQVTPHPGLSPVPFPQEQQREEQHLKSVESELSSKRKECENLEHEVKKRQKRCLDLESQLKDERSKNEQLEEQTDLLRTKAELLDQTQTENEELREDLSKVTAQHNSVLEENERLRAKLENLEQVLKHMREVAERRQQLELEHEQALAILKFKQDEIKRLQRAQLFAKREHEGVVQMLESKVRDLEEKCRIQSEQFGLLSQELENFRLQASKVDLTGSILLNNPSFSVLTNGVGLTTERDCTADLFDMVSLGEIAFWSLEGGDTLSCPEDVAAALRMGATPHAAGLSRLERSPVTKHRDLPTISISKPGSTSSKSETKNVSLHKSSSTHEGDTASEVEELDVDIAPAPYTPSRGAAKLQVFIARYSYNPYDGPNDNPELELPLTAGEYIYVYGDMDDDGFYEGELMDGRRGLVPSNFVERVSDDDVMNAHPGTGDMSHNSLLDSSLHSASHQHHLQMGASASERTEASAASGPTSAPLDSASALAVLAPLTNGLDLDLEEVGVDTVPYPRKLTLIKQLAKSIIIGWDPPLVPAGWGNVWSYNVYIDQELRLNVPFGSQTKAVLERLDINLKTYRVSVQSLTEKGLSEQLRCSFLVGRDVCVAPTQLRVEKITATSANVTWLPSNSNYVHIVSLNDEECELVKAGCYSLCLNNLLPSLQYTVKVEARPHRTPWELPVEKREHRSATVTFTTLMAGPPDAPLDVQLEHGPSPGIAVISWLPVTIDAGGTSNGVHVTGYTIYADKRKVLEVSSPTAGSALLGPSQIQSLLAAQELTVRTMSAHGESCDSFPVSVRSKLATITAGPPVVPPVASSSIGSNKLPMPSSNGNATAKLSMLPCSLPSDIQTCGLTVEPAVNHPHALHSENLHSSASYVKAWANPSSSAILAVCEATLPVSVTLPITSAPLPAIVPAAAPEPSASLTQSSVTPSAAVLEQSRDTDSPGTICPFPSITEFIEDPCAKLGTPEPILTPPKAPTFDLLNLQDTNLLGPPPTLSLESEVDEEIQSTRLVSIEEFLRQDQEPYARTQQTYSRAHMEPLSDYHADNSRSDLSDILEEEEEGDLYSDHLSEKQGRGYTVGANRTPRSDLADRDEEVMEKILTLPPQVCSNKQLFSIPEVTEEEDSSLEEYLSHQSQSHSRPRDLEHLLYTPQHYLNHHTNCPPQNPQFNRDPRSLTKEPSLTHKRILVRPKIQHRVHYTDMVDTLNFTEEEDMSLYEGPTSRRVSPCCPPQPNRNSKERVLIRGLGDRLRREAMLRSQMAVTAATNPGYGLTLPRPCPVSKTVKSSIIRGVEIDVEYGTDDNEEPVECGPREVVVDHMSSEWWGEGAEKEHCTSPQRRVLKADPLDLSQIHPAEAGPSWGTEAAFTSKPLCSQARQLGGGVKSPKIRIFVALFSYEPATMSPNPDAAEEELPFSEGQIIKVHGEKDPDGFYRGECCGHLGFVPCNMVSEIQVEDEEMRQQLLQQGFLSMSASMDKIGTRTHAQTPRRPVPPPKPRRSKKVESAALWEESVDSSSQDPSQFATNPTTSRNPASGASRMVAIFDYDPRESSPNTDIEAELTFSAGDVIQVFGDMDEDGFFYGDLNGHKGLVPSNFLQALPEDLPAEQVSAQPAPEPKRESQTTSSELQDLGFPALEETLPSQEESNKQTDPEAEVEIPTLDALIDPGPGASLAVCSLSPSPRLTQTDCSSQGKKKTSFFSKGKKLLRKLGSSKKD
ncbi:peripheral-type benzodiazepine receptor-associated protein 1 isoform X7 [Takifugu flavidus]|uniref:peripheral-type benzodiazepine receptor-associated protein 1 isoform X7 n=1 Tax=Takifugu flavidus TaxID=433684 RepID=UPI002544CD69|nr:peripheral-type benzodiazepine receptor-associated protein 1 isoform X7 [Takifugu flavidus]